jgi:hypothetical protein
MISVRPNKWIVILWGLAGVLSASDLFLALKSADGHIIPPNSEMLRQGSRLLLAVAVSLLFSARRGPVPIAVAVGALTLGIWAALVK